ncbi:MAG: hypothetical protein JXB07_07230 [Anaerolineae bacterium]|nr:hypothetical protein [Anaerolineae bacterium]
MSSFSISPRLVRGAIIGFDMANPVASVAIFQYNPDTLTRTLQAQTSGGESGSRSEPQRLKGPPIESIRMDVEIDAADQLETGDSVATSMGIYPQLSALEMLLYPKMLHVIANTMLLAAGTIEVVPVEGPFTLLVWGPKRVLPVRLTEFSITEEAYDPNLNPIRAKVSLGLRVMSYSDFPVTHPGYAMFLAHQTVKEAMAVVGSVGNVASLGVNLV